MLPIAASLSLFCYVLCVSSVVSWLKPISRDEAFAQHAKLSQQVAQQYTPPKPKNPVGRPLGSTKKRKHIEIDVDDESTTTTPSTTPTSTSSDEQKQGSYNNWWVPYKWTRIEEAVAKKRNIKNALAYLKVMDKETFGPLRYQVMWRWFDKKTLKLKQKYERIKKNNESRWQPQKHMRKENSGSKSPVTEETRNEIANILLGLRQSSMILNPFVMQPIIKRIVQEHQPEILKENGGEMTVSYSWIRKFVKTRFDWTVRRGTQATRKRPETWKQDVEKMIMRGAIMVDTNKVPEALMINLDQTGIHMVPNGGQMTYETKGSKQVDITGSDDKKQITAVVTSAADGTLLPIQLIFTGQQERTLPTSEASQSARQSGFHMTNSKNHWSNINTMKQYMEHIIVPYVQKTRERLKLSDDSKVILVLDAWSVHRGQAFRDYIASCHPYIVLLYVPAGCTGEAQPADISIQRAIKIAFKKQFQTWLSNSVFIQLQQGTTPEKTKVDFRMPVLRELIPGWMLSAHTHVANNTSDVLTGWKKSGLLRAFKKEEQDKAYRYSTNTETLLDKKACPVPTTDEKPRSYRIDDIDDDDEYDTMSETEEEEEDDWEQQQEQDEREDEEKHNDDMDNDEKHIATTLASIKLNSRPKRTIKTRAK